VSSYLAGKIQVAKFIVIAAATILPPWYLAMCAESAAIVRYVDRHLEISETKGGAPTTGDIVSVSSQVRASPIALPERLSRFQRSLMVVERVEERSRKSWVTEQRYAWTADDARIGRWHLDRELILHGGFMWYRPSPCYDYRPPVGWVAECGDSPYAIGHDNDDRRVSYEVTPITNRVVTLIAAVSPGKEILSPIALTWSSDPDPFAFLVWDAQEPHAVLASRVRSLQQAMFLSWFVIVAVATGWMHAALSRAEWQSASHLAVAALWRGLAIAAPLLSLFVAFENWMFIPAAFGSALAGAGIGIHLWRVARA
jgi:hypothetical protein